MYFGEMCECNNFQCGVDTRARLCSGEEHIRLVCTTFIHLRDNINSAALAVRTTSVH